MCVMFAKMVRWEDSRYKMVAHPAKKSIDFTVVVPVWGSPSTSLFCVVSQFFRFSSCFQRCELLISTESGTETRKEHLSRWSERTASAAISRITLNVTPLRLLIAEFFRKRCRIYCTSFPHRSQRPLALLKQLCQRQCHIRQH